MSSAVVEVDQDALNTLATANYKIIANLGFYENVGKAHGTCGKGLVFLQKLMMAILSLCPQCQITKTQWRAAIMDANRNKNFNSSGLSHKIWAGQRAERLLTIQNHLRRVFREPQRLVQATSKMSRQDAQTLQTMVHKVVGDATRACDTEEECPSPQASRTLKRNASQESVVSCDSTGIPNVLKSPVSRASCQPGSPVQQSFLSTLDDDDAPATKKKPAAAATKKKPTAAKTGTPTSTSTVMDNVKDLFTLKTNYASAQSYIHIIMPNKKKLFVTGKTTGDHQKYIKLVVSKLKTTVWKKPIKAEQVKNAARLIIADM
jgi:hypothetical protein